MDEGYQDSIFTLMLYDDFHRVISKAALDRQLLNKKLEVEPVTTREEFLENPKQAIEVYIIEDDEDENQTVNLQFNNIDNKL